MKNKISIERFGKIGEVDVVQRYKHMGTIATESGAVAPEIVARANAVWGKTRKLRKQLFGASDIRLDVKRGAMQSMMMSSQVFQSGCWPILSSSEYRTCKTAIVKVYKLVCTDAYMVTGSNTHSCDDSLPDSIVAATHWRSDDEIVDIAQQLHPAVLLRLQRICTSIRMAVRGSWEVWKLLYAAKDADRSWASAVHADIRWLAASSTTFQDLDVSSLAAWLKMAKANPHATMQAAKKVCGTPKAVQLAIALATNSEEQVANGNATADNEVYECDVCGYTCYSKSALKCHQTSKHEVFSDLARCIDTCGCTICGLTFESIHLCYIHAAKSSVCKNNLLLRGPYLSGQELKDSMIARSEFTLKNRKAGNVNDKISSVCVRAFGPHLPIFGVDGFEIVASEKGHPLGKGSLHLPPQLLDAVKELDLPCEASRYTVCDSRCLLCKGHPEFP